MIRALDVIWIHDDVIRPPGPKMVVCIEPGLGLFFRINTRPWQIPAALVRLPDHPFLDHDSFLECGEPLELDDYIVDEALRRRGVIGRIAPATVPEILSALDQARRVSAADKAAIRAALRPPARP